MRDVKEKRKKKRRREEILARKKRGEAGSAPSFPLMGRRGKGRGGEGGL